MRYAWKLAHGRSYGWLPVCVLDELTPHGVDVVRHDSVVECIASTPDGKFVTCLGFALFREIAEGAVTVRDEGLAVAWFDPLTYAVD